MYFLKNPRYNWDMIPYSALALEVNGYEKDEIHDEAYLQIKESVTSDVYFALTNPESKYRTKIFNSSEELEKELMFYSVKPFYIGAVSFFYFMGISIAQATVLPSCIGFFLLSFILFNWLKKYAGNLLAFLLSFLFVLSPFMREAAMISTPDMLCSSMLITGFYFFVILDKSKLSLVFFILAILSRPDVIIFVALIYLWGVKEKKISLKFLIVSVCFLISLTFILIWITGFPIGSLFLNVQTQERLTMNYSQIPIMRYLNSYLHGFDNHKYNYIFEYLAALIASFFLGIKMKKIGKKNELEFIPLFLTLHLIVFYLINPILDDRYLITEYLICFVYIIYCTLNLYGNYITSNSLNKFIRYS